MLMRQIVSFASYSQPVRYQQFDDKPFRLSAKISKHVLFKSHIVVPDVQDGAAVAFPGKRGDSSQAANRGKFNKYRKSGGETQKLKPNLGFTHHRYDITPTGL